MRQKPSIEAALEAKAAAIREIEAEKVRRKTAELVGAPSKKKSYSGMSDRLLLKLLDEVNAMLREGKWSEATAKHFVALYADLHFRVYGIEPADLDPKQRLAAVSMASSMMQNEFGGSAIEMAEFVRWAWSREKERETWRRENGRQGSRLTWRFQFGRSLLTDYRLERARKAARS